MFTLRDKVVVRAPIERCFLLSTSIEVVQRTLGLHPVAAESRKSSGFIATGDQLVWRGWTFGLPQMHETLITAYEPPLHFQDTMGRGRFAHFQHDHRFTHLSADVNGDEHTLLEDEVRFNLPLGIPGHLVGRLLRVPHIRGLLHRRFELLKRLAEGEEWREYLPSTGAHLIL